MSSGLDPAIFKKLEAFSRRRRKLILLRGIFAALAMLLATMMLVALVDWLFVLPDWLRWTLSGVAYLAVIITEWRACVRLLLHSPDPRRLARLIEHAEPGLREDLLSAVELGQGDSTMDSEQFRRLVQSDVASRLEGVDMNRLLPVQLLRRTLMVAGVVIAACVLVFAISGFQFSTLLMRAMLPMANLARVSKVQVKIVEPNPADSVVAQGDSVPLVIDISGQRTNKAILETFTASGGREIVQMIPAGPDRFSANVQIARENVSYRVRAGDALTRKYELRAAARPHVVRFHKSYTFPAYSGLSPHKVTEEMGDLTALEGSEVELQIEPDQPVKSAELVIEQGKETTTRPLIGGEGGKLTARVSLAASGIYRVKLVARDTGFENKFSPEYELRAEPDLIPQIDLEVPKRDLILPSNEIVEVRATASDDLGIAKISQLVKVNEGPWKEEKLEFTKGKQATVERRGDLYDQGLKAGDLLTFKLRVVDVKGHHADSRPIRISITASGFESKRLTSLDSQRQLLASLKALREAGEALDKRSREAREQFDRSAEDESQRKQAITAFSGVLENFERVAAATASQLQITLGASTPGHSTGEFVLLGRLLGKMTSGTSQNARDLLTVLASNDVAPYAKDLMREAADNCARAGQRARLADEAGRAFVTSESIDVLNENLQVVAREQERIGLLGAELAEGSEKWAPLITRLRVVLSQTKGLEEMMAAASEFGTDGSNDRIRRMQKELEKTRNSVDQVLESGSTGKSLVKAVQNLTRFTTDLRRSAFDLKRDFMQPPARSAQNLLQDIQPSWSNLEKLRQEVESITRNERIGDARAELARTRWDAKAGVLKAHGDYEEARPDSDTYFVSDVRATALALTGMRDPALVAAKPFGEKDPETASFATLDLAFRVLESAHNLAEAHDGLIRLATAERWEVTALRARTANPRDWEWLERRLKAAPEELSKLQLKDEAAKEAVKAAQKILRDAEQASPWKTVNEEMKQRMRPEVNPRGVAMETDQVAAALKLALDALRDQVQIARQNLAQLAPKLSELMAQLAKEAQALKEKTSEQAQKAAEKKPEEAQADARQQLAQQQDLSEKVEAVQDALRSEANKQDMFDKEGRELARDADDALAMLKEPPPKAEEALENAAAAAEAEPQKQALEEAAQQQQKLADALKQLAQHYDAVEKGKPEETRLALREAEKDLGVKQALDQRYARAEQLAQLAQATPDEMLKQLEQALQNNPLMQQELSGIAKNTLAAASEKLADASARESAVAEQVNKLAGEQQKAAEETAKKAAAEKAAADKAAAEKAMADAQKTAEAEKQKQMAQNDPAAPKPADGQDQPKTPAAPTPSGSEKQTASTPQPKSPDKQAGQEQMPAPAAQPQAPDPKLAQAATQQTPIAQAATQAGEQVARAGRHEQRLQNKTAGETLEQLGKEIEETAKNEVAQAQQALEKSAMAGDAKTPVEAALNELKAEAGQLAKAQVGDMSATPEPAGAQTPSAAPPAGQSPSPAQESPAGTAATQPPTPASAPPQGQQPATSPGTPAMAQAGQQGTPASQNPPAPTSAAQPAPGEGQMAQQPPMAPGAIKSELATPQEQVWMARTLDALDAALNASVGQPPQQPQDPNAAGQQQPAQQPGNAAQQQQQAAAQSAEAMAKAQQAMAAAAQAAAAAARASRAQENKPPQPPSSQVAQGDQQAKSETGALAEGGNLPRTGLPNAQLTRTTEWGKLPKKVAEQLSQGQREAVAGEYRNQVETYYRVIAERAKKP